MRKLFWLAACVLMAASCAPEIYTHYLDVRKPSDSGLNLSRKTMAMVYMDSDVPADTVFNRGVASSLARAMEEDYFDGQEVIGLYRIPKADSLSLDLMHSLVMDTGEDVIFLLVNSLGDVQLEARQEVRNARSVDSAYVTPALVPLSTSVFVYDSMGEDMVRRFSGSTLLRPAVYNNGLVPEENLKDQTRMVAAAGEAEKMGERISRRFVSNWQTESFSFYYFDDSSSEQWELALVNALEGKFAAAIDGWAPFLKADDERKQACACYNLAMAFYMMENRELATRWLDLADTLYPDLALSPGLRKRIEDQMK